MDRHNLFIDNWFKEPPKQKNDNYIIKKEKIHKKARKKYAKKLHENRQKETRKKSG